MSYLCFEDRVASWSALSLVEERNNVLTIYRHPRGRRRLGFLKLKPENRE